MPQSDWILDVLADIGAYAESNDLPKTAEAVALLEAVVLDELNGQARKPAPEKGDNFVLLSDFDRVL